MAEDWRSIAAEVAGALQSVGSTDAGWPITIWVGQIDGPIDPDRPWQAPPKIPHYVQFTGIQKYVQVRDVDGTLIDQTRHTVIVNATTGYEPTEDMKVALGVAVDDADGDSEWIAIIAVRPLAPAGVPVMYEIDLVR